MIERSDGRPAEVERAGKLARIRVPPQSSSRMDLSHAGHSHGRAALISRPPRAPTRRIQAA